MSRSIHYQRLADDTKYFILVDRGPGGPGRVSEKKIGHRYILMDGPCVPLGFYKPDVSDTCRRTCAVYVESKKHFSPMSLVYACFYLLHIT